MLLGFFPKSLCFFLKTLEFFKCSKIFCLTGPSYGKNLRFQLESRLFRSHQIITFLLTVASSNDSSNKLIQLPLTPPSPSNHYQLPIHHHQFNTPQPPFSQQPWAKQGMLTSSKYQNKSSPRYGGCFIVFTLCYKLFLYSRP